ncbi:MAG: DUF4340 domain-containing protein [bacterium]
MSRKNSILGILLFVLVISAYAYQVPLKKWQNNLGKPENIFSKVKADSIDKIEIIGRGERISLAKQNQKWKYGGSKDFYADPSAIDKVFEELKKAASSEIELVSNNKERKSEFGTDDSGVEVKIYQDGKPVLDFFAGKMASDYSGSYFSFPESAASFAVKADLNGAFSREDWRDWTIFSSPADKIDKIRFQYPNREFTVEMKGGEWAGVLPEKFAVNQEKMKNILNIMSDLKASEIPEQVFAGTGLEKHLIIVQASGQGIDNVLMAGQAAGGDLYYAKKGDSDNIYLISKFARDELDKWIWQLK